MRPPRQPSLRATARYSTSQSRLRPAAARSPASTCVASTRLASDCPPSGRRTLASSLAERTGRRPAALQIRALRPPPRRGPAPISSAPLQLRPPHRGVPLGSATGSNASAVPLGFHRGRRAPRTRAACLSAAPRSPETRLTRLPCLLCAGAVPNLRTAQAAPLLRLTARQDLLRLETFAVGSTSGEHYVIPHEVHPCVCKIVSP